MTPIDDFALIPYPPDVPLLTYQDMGLTFLYPASARLFSEEVMGTPHLHILFPGLEYVALLLHPLPDARSALEAAQLGYARLSSIAQDPYHIQPSEISLPIGEGWHTRKRFYEGGNASLIFDVVYFRVGERVFMAQFNAHPQAYAEHLWFFTGWLLSLGE